MKYIQKNAANIIIALCDSKPAMSEDANGRWLEVEDHDVIIAENGKIYYQQVDEIELAEFKKNKRVAEIHHEIKMLEDTQSRQLKQLELMTLGVVDESKKNEVLEKLKQIQAEIESLRSEFSQILPSA